MFNYQVTFYTGSETIVKIYRVACDEIVHMYASFVARELNAIMYVVEGVA